jgi:hypothetical protein
MAIAGGASGFRPTRGLGAKAAANVGNIDVVAIDALERMFGVKSAIATIDIRGENFLRKGKMILICANDCHQESCAVT